MSFCSCLRFISLSISSDILSSVTLAYAKVTQDKIDRDVDKLGEAIEGKFSLYGIDARPSTIRKDITCRKSNPSWKQMAIIKQMMEG